MSKKEIVYKLTDALYNELVDFQNEEYDENIQELVGYLAEFKAKIEGDTGSFSEDEEYGIELDENEIENIQESKENK